MDRDTTTKRFVMECFEDPNPPNVEAEGDACEFFDALAEARKRAAALLNAGRFKYLALWVESSGDWAWQEDFRPGETGDV